MTPNRSSKRRLLSAGLQFALAATLGSAAPFAVAAEAYPAQTIKVIIPFPPGGTLDAVGRALAQRLSEQLGKPVIVDNRPGGNATIGPVAVARARPMATPCSSTPRRS